MVCERLWPAREKLALMMTCNLNELSTIEGKHLIGVSDTVNILGRPRRQVNQVWTTVWYVQSQQSRKNSYFLAVFNQLCVKNALQKFLIALERLENQLNVVRRRRTPAASSLSVANLRDNAPTCNIPHCFSQLNKILFAVVLLRRFWRLTRSLTPAG